MPPHRNAYRAAVAGRRGAVASAHPIATLAGMQMLLEGGNAVDAAVAVASSLSVVEPYMSGVGGIGLMIYFSAKEQKPYLLDFVGRAPQSADPADATRDQLDHGPRSSVTPGTLGGWLAAHERFVSM